MNREEIYDRACEFAEERINEGMLYDTRTEIQFAFERGAEWMQEQMIKQARNAFCKCCHFDCEGHPHDDCTLLQKYIQTIKGE